MQTLRFDFLVSETLGSDTYLIGDVGGTRVTARCAPMTRARPSEQLLLHANTAQIHLFDPTTRNRIATA